MADRIRYETDAMKVLQRRLHAMTRELQDDAGMLERVDTSQAAGGELRARITGKLSGGVSYSGRSVSENVQKLADAMRGEALHLVEMCERLSRVESVFEKAEDSNCVQLRSLSTGDDAVYHGVNRDAQSDVTQVHVSYRGQKVISASDAAPVLGAAAGSKKPMELSNEDAQDLINFFLGDGMVSQFLFFYNPDKKVEKYFKVLTGDTKGMTQAEVNQAILEFVTIAKIMNAATANERIEHLQEVINHLGDWASDAESGHNKAQIESFVLDELGMSLPGAPIDLELVTVGLTTLLTAEDVLLEIPQAKYAQSLLKRLEKTGSTKVTIDSVISGQASADDLVLDTTISNHNKKEATKYAQMLYDLEQSVT